MATFANTLTNWWSGVKTRVKNQGGIGKVLLDASPVGFVKHYASPIKKAGEGFVEGSAYNLVDIPNAPSQTLEDKAGYATGYVASILNPFNPVNKIGLFGKLGQVGNGVATRAVSRIAPKATGVVAKKLLPIVGEEVAQSLGYAGLATASGLTGLRGEYDASPKSILTDIGWGLGMRGAMRGTQKYIDTTIAKMSPEYGGKPQRKIMNPKDISELERATDVIRDKKSTPQDIKWAKDTIYHLADIHLTKNAYTDNGNALGMSKDLLKIATQSENQNRPAFGMGFVDDTPRKPEKIEIDLDRYKKGSVGYSLKGQVVDNEYLDLLKKKGWSENEIDYAIKVANNASDVKNPKGFVVGVLRKMNGKAEKKIGYSPVMNLSQKELAKIDQAVGEYDAMSIKPPQTETIPTSPNPLDQTISPEVPPITTQPPIPFTQKVVERLTSLKQTLLDPKKISKLSDTDRGVAIKTHVAHFDEMGLAIKEELATRGIAESDFAAMVRGEIETPPHAVDLVDSWRNIFKHDEAQLRANKEFGKQENYWPMEGGEGQIDRELTEFLPNTFVSKINKLLGHYMPSTGAMAKSGEYTTDPLTVLHNYGEQEAISRYDKKGLFETAIEGVVKAIQKGEVNLYDKKGKTVTDYLEMLNPDKNRIKSKVELHSLFGEDWATNENRNFSKLSDDVYQAYVQVRDARSNAATLKDEFQAVLDTGDNNQMIRWLAEKLNITDPNAQVTFERKANWVIEKFGGEKLFNNVANKLIYEQPMQGLLDTLTKYEFDGTTKKYLNEWIERQFAERFVNKSLAANLADGTNRMFRIAQLGMNFKTAALQPLEIFRSFAKMPKETLAVFKEQLKDRNFLNEIDSKYKVAGANPYFIDEDTIKVGELSLPKKALSKVEQAGFFALSKAEDFKNKVFAAAAEQSGMAQGLQGQELTDYVRNYVYKYGLKIDKSSVPLMFAGKSDGAAFRRLLFQYGQYAVSKLIHRVDAVKEKDWKYLGSMIAGDMATFMVLNQMFGVDVGQYLKGEGVISFGPIVGLGEDLVRAGKDYATDLQSDDPSEANNNLAKELKRIGMANFMPYGAQINKTTKMANILNKGYYESAGGRVGYVPPENPIKQGWGLVAGVQSTNEYQDYKKSGYKVLPETVSNQIKEVSKTDKQAGRQWYELAREAERAKKEEKRQVSKAMSEILKGGNTLTAEQKNVVESRQEMITNLVKQGITDTNEIKNMLNLQVEAAGLGAAPFETSEIEVYKNLALTTQPSTLFDTVTQNKAEKDRLTKLNRVMTSEDYGELGEDQRKQLALQLGYSEADLNKWQVSQLTKMTTKETADYIIANKQTDFVSLYNADALTPSVAQELERRGYIDDADALMDKMKLTDPYYQRKALRKAKLDFGTKKLKLQASTAQKLNNARFRSMKELLKAKKPRKFAPKSLKFTSRKSTTTSLAKPTKYTVKKYKPNF
jgi:hypothetical protein